MREIYDLWFSSLNLSNKTKLELLQKYDTKEIWELDFESIVEAEIPEEEAIRILKSKNLEEEKRILEYMLQKKIQLISVKDEKYPRKLHQIEDKPAFLYVRGNEAILDDDSVRCGGLQNGDRYGKKCSEDFKSRTG